MTKNQKGFTLVELMIVVAIIGVLAAVAIPKFADMLEKSREGATKGNLSGEIGFDLPVLIHNTALQAVPDYRIRAGVTYRF